MRNPTRTSGDGSFPQPKDGMLSVNLTSQAGRDFWAEQCVNITATGYVDGCFSDRGNSDPAKYVLCSSIDVCLLGFTLHPRFICLCHVCYTFLPMLNTSLAYRFIVTGSAFTWFQPPPPLVIPATEAIRAHQAVSYPPSSLSCTLWHSLQHICLGLRAA